jgi:hypothetical protein
LTIKISLSLHAWPSLQPGILSEWTNHGNVNVKTLPCIH